MIYNDTIYTDTKRLGILGMNSNMKEGDGASKSAVYQARPVLAFLTFAAPSLKPCRMLLHVCFAVCLSSPRDPRPGSEDLCSAAAHAPGSAATLTLGRPTASMARNHCTVLSVCRK